MEIVLREVSTIDAAMLAQVLQGAAEELGEDAKALKRLGCERVVKRQLARADKLSSMAVEIADAMTRDSTL